MLFPSPVRSRPYSPRFRPSLESLESRDCPSAPEMSLNVSYGANNQVTLSGQVVDDTSVEGLTIQFMYAYEGTATTDACGNFSVTYSASLGLVQAYVFDLDNNISNLPEVMIDNAYAEIQDFVATYDYGTQWTLSGRVVDESAAGLVVNFTGLPCLEGRTAIVDSNGMFVLVVEIPEGEYGTVSAWVDDWFGNQSWGYTSI